MKFKFNIPNKITIIRVALIPLFAAVLLADIPYKSILSAFIFGMLSVSDFLDGYFARKKRQVTEFGKLIDPIADKLLISTALIFLIGKGVELWMALAIIAREIIITAIRIYLVPSKIVVPASNFGKAKTVVQSLAIVFALLQLPLSYYFMLAAVFLTVASGLEYLIRIRKLTGKKIINLPNLITLCRLLLIIPFVYFFLKSEMQLSLLIFAAITLTDKLDGISARLMNQKTELGSGLDSFTDWTVIFVTLVLFVIKNYINVLWVALLIIPSIISGVMKMTYAKRQKVVPVTFVARLSVGLTYITIISFLINFRYTFYFLVSAILITYISMAVYILKTFALPKAPVSKKKAAA
ncbi:CDP-diacylglycerol--glycerol-3-phosphate 3-phosphatidyltransferase [Candidatus Woesearchaeota archaeon]|nr:CDP-diacylglycerol--glycerol-3-phosphate 3-phosphatidyltransferase [Candidatus Woesearchaeota archaeon]